jgi:hypothetical protein
MIVIDQESYILDGILYEIPLVDAPLNEESAERAVDFYKKKMVDTGLAFGKLHTPIQESLIDEVPEEEYKKYLKQDPVSVAMGLGIASGFDDEEVINPNDAAFQILDILYDSVSKSIIGRIHLLETPTGIMARNSLDEGKKCIISQANVDEVVDNKDRHRGGFTLNQIIRKIRGGWRLAFENKETTNQKNEIGRN